MTRLAVWLHHWQVDRELAAGLSPTLSKHRAALARQLVAAGERRRLARSLRVAVSQAESSRHPRLTTAVPVRRQEVVAWREALLGLADRLDQPQPVSPRGMAQVIQLLTDGTGPLYNRTPLRSLGEMIWWAADGLTVDCSHEWDCPVLMKVDPSHIAWTCRHCGAIATSRDYGSRPGA